LTRLRTEGVQKMEIKRSGSQPSSKGSGEYFTGTVRIDPLFQPEGPARTLGAFVTFEPGARTAWHAHPLGQVLIVTAGCGPAQGWGGPIEQIRPGDVVRFAPGEKHWHGATGPAGLDHRLASHGCGRHRPADHDNADLGGSSHPVGQHRPGE
jgi:quercetin dioxygenase-like cupin family protein